MRRRPKRFFRRSIQHSEDYRALVCLIEVMDRRNPEKVGNKLLQQFMETVYPMPESQDN